LKVLMLNYEYPPLGGGAANATFYLLKEFAKLPGIEIDLVTTSATGRFELEKLGERIAIHKLPIKKKALHYWTQREVWQTTYRSYFYAKRLVKQKDYDLAHAFFGIPGGLVAFLLKGRLPYIVSLRGSDVPGFNLRFSAQYVVLTPLIRKIWRSAAQVIANSQGLKELALSTKSDQEIGVIRNGIDTIEFNPGPGKKAAGRSVICVSRLIERKGIDMLIKAMPLVKKEIDDVRLSLVGEGNLEAELRALAGRLDMGPMVDWAGYVEHSRLPALYRQADLFVLPSHNEGMSNALLEAMACGLPVIVSRTGGVRELIDDNGVTLADVSPEAIAQAIIGVFKDRERAEAMARSSLAVAKAHSWSAVSGAYLKSYQETAHA
jgi:L-malate glycosyltransferase